MKIRKLLYLMLSGLALLNSCKEENKYQFPDNAVTITKVSDIGNKGNAADLWAEIAINEEIKGSSLVEIRTLFVKATSTATISQTDVLNLPVGNYYSISTFNFRANRKIIIEPTSTAKDIEGNPVSGENEYRIYVAMIGKENAFSLSNMANLKLSSNSQYPGKYIGTWNDQLIKNLGISMIIFDDNTGRLFYSRLFAPCCGGSEDATFIMKLNSDATAEFDFNQFLGDYPKGTGGHCTTQMSTSGHLENSTLLLKSFPFSDCDGGGRTVVISGLTQQ